MSASVRPRLMSSLRWRLATAISGIVLLCAALSVAGSVLFLREALTTRARVELQRTLTGVSGYLRTQRGDLLLNAKLLADDVTVTQKTQQHSRPDLINHLRPFYADLNVDVIDIVDNHGRVIVRMENEDPLASGDSVLRLSSVRSALAGRATIALEPDPLKREAGTGYALRATVPIHSGPRIVGAVVVGRRLDSIFAARIGSALATDVNVIAGSQRTGTTLVDSHGLLDTSVPEPPSILRRIANNKTSIAQRTENGQTALSGIVPLTGSNGKPAGAIEIVNLLDPLYDLITKLSFLLIAVGAGVVILGTILALDIARRLTSRLLALEATASHVSAIASRKGPLGHLHLEMAVEGNDEVASLARSLRLMMLTIDERETTNARLLAASKARLRELSGLAEIARLLTAGPSVGETLELLGEQVSRLVGCSAVAILVPRVASLPYVVGGHNLPDEYKQLMESVLCCEPDPAFEFASQVAIRTGSVVTRPIDHGADGLPETHRLLRHKATLRGWKNSTSIPLRVQDRVIGVLTCYSDTPDTISPNDLSLLTTIADQVAVAVENARLHAASRDLAALEERSRLARELHDSVTQALFSMTLHARAAQMAVELEGINPAGKVSRSIRQLHDLTQGALAEMRALIFELRPGALQEEGLAAALNKHTAALSAREGLEIEIRAPDERIALAPATEENLYRLAQEALHNVVKHAAASRVVVTLEILGSTLLMQIEDNGIGFDTADVAPGHLGLSTMAERARQIDGQLQCSSEIGHGTCVRIVVSDAVSASSTEAERIEARAAGTG